MTLSLFGCKIVYMQDNNQENSENNNEIDVKPVPQQLLDNQWKKGQSGNPNGRPKGTRNFMTDFNEAIRHIQETKGVEFPLRDIMVRLASEASKGNMKAMKIVTDYLYEKPNTKDPLMPQLNAETINLIIPDKYAKRDPSFDAN